MSPHAKHTPGPWSVSHDGYYPVVIKRFRPDHHMQVCGPVHGYMYSPDEKGEQVANAHLIAASPALFEALKEAIPTLEFDERQAKHDASTCHLSVRHEFERQHQIKLARLQKATAALSSAQPEAPTE